MPQKTDGILFELHPRPTRDEEGRPLLYAQAVIGRKYTIDDIDDFCAKYRHTSRGEILRLCGLLEEVTASWLRQGNRVETPFGKALSRQPLPGRSPASQVLSGGPHVALCLYENYYGYGKIGL